MCLLSRRIGHKHGRSALDFAIAGPEAIMYIGTNISVFPLMTDQPESTPVPSNPIRRRLVTAAPAPQSQVKLASPAAEGVDVSKPRFLTPELQMKMAQEQMEAAQRAEEQAEADRVAAEQEAVRQAAELEAARIAAAKEAARIAAEEEAARIKAEQEAEEAARLAEEQASARMAADKERMAAEQAQMEAALAKVAEAQKALAEAQAAALAKVSGTSASQEDMPAAPVAEPSPAISPGSLPKLKVLKASAAVEEPSVAPVPAPTAADGLVKLKSPFGSPPAPSGVPTPVVRPISAVPSAAPLPVAGGGLPPLGGGDKAGRELAASVDKSKTMLRMVIYGVCVLVLAAASVGIYAWRNNSEKERIDSENSRLTELVEIGGKLGQSNLYDSKSLDRVPGVKVVPNAEDAELLLANVRGKKGHEGNWPGAVHLVCIMAQMDDNIARQVMDDMKKNVRQYGKDKYAMMVALLSKSSSPAMRDMLKDLYAYISKDTNKKVQEKQAVVLKFMRNAMKLEDLDDVMKVLQDKKAAPELSTSAYRAARYLIDKAPEKTRLSLSSKLQTYQKDMPEDNMTTFYKLLARTGDPKVLDAMEKMYKTDSKKSLGIMSAWGDWNTDDAVPYLVKAWRDESLHQRVRTEAHDSILRVLSVDRDRDDNATLKLFDPLVADAKTSERRQFLVSAFRKLSNRPYVNRLLGRIKQTAEENLNQITPKFDAASVAIGKAEEKFKNNPEDAAAKADYEAKEKEYNDLFAEKTGEEKVIVAVEKALEKIKKTPAPSKTVKSLDDKEDDDESSVIKKM